jgi:hypothetical protein
LQNTQFAERSASSAGMSRACAFNLSAAGRVEFERLSSSIRGFEKGDEVALEHEQPS